ncbi:zinc protease [Pedobacter steynii]|uniref:Zinc protease n=1 Tax=Pedobacter steynii TaxID=430522 RepID=A0A1G9P724_9SPHI|nr:M16 family metallopeptidase [Pedobacter steynii]NQX39080.1 insulinase family protein [Pedobacter steynii]SDL94311.1 zinc protease [Pedobacter steynii]
MKIKYLFAWGFILVGLCSANAQVLPLDPDVRTGKLPNGFTYYIRQNNEPKNRVVLYLANKVGSILETDEQQGLAHFMEHMSFNGTKNFPKNELVNYLQKTGVRFGADLNAYTGFDETVYQLPLPSDDPQVLRNGIQILRDWAAEATLETSEIDQERGVIIEEKRLGKGANQRIQEQILPVLLNNSRYAKRLPIGTDEVLLNFKPEAIRNYYRDWYRPNLQALIVVGDINVDEMEKVIRDKFSDLKNPADEKPRENYEVPLTGKNQFLVATDKEMTSTVAQLIIKHKAPELKTENDYRNLLIRSLFNQMLGNRYMELSRQANPPYVQGSAKIETLMGGLDSFSILVVAKPNELENGFKAVLREMCRVQQSGFSETELDRAKQGYLSSMEAAVKERDKTPSDAYVQEYLQHFLLETGAPGIDKEFELVSKIIPEITNEDINRICAEYISNINRDIIITAPEKDKSSLPDESTVLNWVNSVEKENFAAFKDDVSNLPLLASTPVPGKVVGKDVNSKLGITTLKLSNGAKVVLKKTDFRNNEILFKAYSEGGTSLYGDNDYETAHSAAGLIASGGLGNYNVTQLSKYLSGKQLSVAPFIGERTQGFYGSSSPKDLEMAFQLLYGYFTEPRKDAELVKGLLANAKNGLANREDDPSQVFNDTVSAVLNNYNIRRTGPSIEKVNQIDLDRALQIYKERFSNASNMIFTFVGSIDEAQIIPLLEKYIASLPSTGKVETARDLGIEIPKGKISKTVFKGKEQKSTVYLVYSGPFDYSHQNTLNMNALNESLQIRLNERLREEESGVYTPKIQIGVTKYPKSSFNLVISFGCAPENVDRLIVAAVEEIEKLRKLGPGQENVDKFKAEDSRMREMGLKTNGFWSGYLNEQMLSKEPLDQVFNYDAAMSKVTVRSIQELAAKYLTGENYIKLVLMPEK